MNTLPKRITLATIKAFVNKNRKDLFILVETRFNGMSDCVEGVKSVPIKAKEETRESMIKYTLGIKGAWFVGNSRNYFETYEDDVFKGYSVSNCCGSFKLGVIK